MKQIKRSSLSWEKFRKAFEDKYFSSLYRNINRNGFMRLVQGLLTVVKYEKKFTEMLKYATFIGR